MAFVQELPRFYELISSGAAGKALAELRQDAHERVLRFKAHDRGLIPELVEVKADLVRRAPEVDDSPIRRPRGTHPPPLEWQFGFANFDQIASHGPDRLVVAQGQDTSASGMLLRILDNKLRQLRWRRTGPSGATEISQENLRPDLDDLARRVRNLGDRHRHAEQEFSQEMSRHGGFQVAYLDGAIEQMRVSRHRCGDGDGGICRVSRSLPA